MGNFSQYVGFTMRFQRYKAKQCVQQARGPRLRWSAFPKYPNLGYSDHLGEQAMLLDPVSPNHVPPASAMLLTA